LLAAIISIIFRSKRKTKRERAKGPNGYSNVLKYKIQVGLSTRLDGVDM